MLNFGLTEMRLVAPRDGWPNPDAGPAASGADIVLEQAQLFDSVADAIADCSQVFASTVRRRDLVMPVLAPGEMADRIGSSSERSAILFGPERSGLETEDDCGAAVERANLAGCRLGRDDRLGQPALAHRRRVDPVAIGDRAGEVGKDLRACEHNVGARSSGAG